MEERLPDFVLSELFSDYLVFMDEKQPAGPIPPKPGKEIHDNSTPGKIYLGNYQRKIIVIVNDTEHPFTCETNLGFLMGVLNACKLNLADIALVNFYKYPYVFPVLKKEMFPEIIIMFGITSLQIELPFAMPDYQVQEYDKCKILTAPGLNELNRDTKEAKSEKAKLWKCLKTLFSL